ncbi:MAG: hypothetical protein ABI321_23740 [Polyangia bacterium]
MGSLKKLALGLVLLSPSCFKTPAYTDGQLKCSTDVDDPCPGRASCVAGYCYHAPDLAISFDGGDGGDAGD